MPERMVCFRGQGYILPPTGDTPPQIVQARDSSVYCFYINFLKENKQNSCRVRGNHTAASVSRLFVYQCQSNCI